MPWETPESLPDPPPASRESVYEGRLQMPYDGPHARNCLQLRGTGDILDGNAIVSWDSDRLGNLSLQWSSPPNATQRTTGDSPQSLGGLKGNLSSGASLSIDFETEPRGNEVLDVVLRLRYVGDPEPRLGTCLGAEIDASSTPRGTQPPS